MSGFLKLYKITHKKNYLDAAKKQDALLVMQHPFDFFRHYWKKMQFWNRIL